MDIDASIDVKSTHFVRAAKDEGKHGLVEDVPPSEAVQRSIYDLYSARRRYLILGLVSLAAILIPFCDTIYLPALTVVASDLNTDMHLVVTSVSIYMFLVGVAVLVWGPASDRFGRRAIFLTASASFVASSIVCAIAPNITVLVVFRALQGAAVSAFIVTGQGAIADTFPPSQRGTASGIYMVPTLVGPILGPLLGGGLAQAFGWRATFYALIALGAIVGLALLLLFPETHQWFVLARLRKADPTAADAITEAPLVPQPTFKSPLAPLAILLQPSVTPHALATLCTFGFMFATLTELPPSLARPPFSLSEGAIGLAYLALGLGGLLASPGGGIASDLAARQLGVPAARLLPATLAGALITPAALLGFGWALHAPSGSLAPPLAAHFFVGVGCSAYLPGIFSWLSVVQQSAASAAAAGVQACMFIGAAVMIQVASLAVAALGLGPFFSILAGVQLLVTLVAGLLLLRDVRQQRRDIAAAAASAPEAAAAGDAAA